MFSSPFHVMSEPPVTPFELALGIVDGLYFFTVGSTGQTVQVTDDTGRTLYEPDLGAPPTRWDHMRRDDSARIPDLARVPLMGGDATSQVEFYAGKGSGKSYRHLVQPRDGLAAGTPYDWAFNSATMSSQVSVPGTPGVPETLAVEKIGTAAKSVSLSIPSQGVAKEVTWKVAGPVNERWAQLGKMRMEPGQSIAVSLANGGSHLVIANSGPATTAELQVQAGPGARPVSVGVVPIPSGNSRVEFDAPKTTLSYAGGQPGNAGWLVTPVIVSLDTVDYSGTGLAFVEYGLDRTSWTRYLGPFTYPQEGATTLYYRAKDNAGDQETTKSQGFRIDTRPPAVDLAVDKQDYTRTEPFVVHFTATDPVPGSGLARVSADVDGLAVTSGQKVDLLWDALGVHTLTVATEDVAGLRTVRSITFSIVATLDGLEAEVRRLASLGEIKDPGTVTSLLAKIQAAQAAVARGCPDAAFHVLGALLNEIAATQASWFGTRITPKAAGLLTGDVEFVQARTARTCR